VRRLECVPEGQTAVHPGEHARHVIEIIEEAYRSPREGRRLWLASTP